MSATTNGRDHTFIDDEVRLGFDHGPSWDEPGESGFDALVAEVDVLRRISTLQERLFERALAGADASALVDALAQILGRRVTAVWSGSSVGNELVDAPRVPWIQNAVRATAVPIVYEGRVLGHLLIHPTATTPDPTDRVVVTAAARFVALMLHRSRAGPRERLAAQQDLLLDLLRGHGEPEREAVARGSAIGYNLARPASLIVVEADDDTSMDPAVDPGLLAAVREALTGLPCLITPWQSHGVVLIEDQSDGATTFRHGVSTPPVNSAATIREALLRRAPSSSPVVALAPGYSRPTDVSRLYAEAVEAIRVARRLGSIDSVIRADDLDLRAYQILSGERNESRIRSFVADVLGKLAAYDIRHQGALVATLEAYLNHNGNLGATSQALYIHLSTLKYRLARIAEIGGISFHDPQDRFHAQLALRLRRILPLEPFVQSS